MDRRAFLIASAALGVPLSPRSASAANLRRPDLDTLVEVLKTPGLACRAILHGKRIGLVAGVRAAGKPDRVTLDTLFSAASLTKPVFAMAVRNLVRAGKLEWTKPLQDYVAFGLTGD